MHVNLSLYLWYISIQLELNFTILYNSYKLGRQNRCITNWLLCSGKSVESYIRYNFKQTVYKRVLENEN